MKSKSKDVITPIPKEIRVITPEVPKRKKFMAVQAYFENGYDLEVAAKITGFAPELISQWYELYGKDVLKAADSPAVVASEAVKEIVKMQEENATELSKLMSQAIARAKILIEKATKTDDIAKIMDAITRANKEHRELAGGGDSGKLKKGNVYNLINNQQVIVRQAKK